MKDELLIIANLKHGEHWIWPESDYGRAEIWKINNSYLLFGIPVFGGEPFFVLESGDANIIYDTVVNVLN